MELRVIGCHGGETPKHRTSAFILGGNLAVDAGSLTSGMGVDEQAKLTACLVSHAHLDHIRDLATLADNRCQMRCEPLIVAGTTETLNALKRHFFNNYIWPDFSKIPSEDEPTIVFQELEFEKISVVAGYRVKAVEVSHTIEASGFIIADDHSTVAYSGDTGPTDRFWQLLNEEPNLRGLLMEVSFPDEEQGLATASGHHTPKTLAADLAKYKNPESLPTLLYHIKPVFQAMVERECARLKGLNLQVVELQDQFVL
ncbi:MAG: 3',5'-cyclic-nucleotide phosphodiesterase [Polyangiaceae bacterium]|nr:3',5'-cyclic-nucleotide phosphodiesterase [Polyangiaceae bacterium]